MQTQPHDPQVLPISDMADQWVPQQTQQIDGLNIYFWVVGK